MTCVIPVYDLLHKERVASWAAGEKSVAINMFFMMDVFLNAIRSNGGWPGYPSSG